MATQILSTTEYKTAVGISDSSQDAKINQVLPWIDTAIRSYTNRDFGVTPVSGTNTYLYQGGQHVEINDASLITQVTINGQLMLPTAYTPQPFSGPVYTWIDFNYLIRGPSPEMGFMQNLDTFPGLLAPPQIGVTATFGWATIPGDVKLAAVEIAKGYLQHPDTGDGVQSEAIDSYSIAFAQPQGAQPGQSIGLPQKAVDLLDPYRRMDL